MKYKDINIFLDLDQTCISAHETNIFNPKDYEKTMSITPYGQFENYYYIFERPYLQAFLTYIFEHFTVSVYTAASKDYGLYIINNMLKKNHPDRHIKYFFHSYHCDICKRVKNSSKDLSILWNVYNLEGLDETNTFIVDDYDEVYNTQQYNCIVAPPYTFTDSDSCDDTFFLRLLKYLKSTRFTNEYTKNGTIQNVVKYFNSMKEKKPKSGNKRDMRALQPECEGSDDDMCIINGKQQQECYEGEDC
jgi:TFIIF-interacting CTD phosphatase-like protein